MRTGNKIAIWLIVIGLVIVALGFGVEAGNEIEVIAIPTTITCDKGNKYITLTIPADASPGDTMALITRYRAATSDVFTLTPSSALTYNFTFWIADADSVNIYLDTDMADVLVVRSTEK